MNDVFVKIRDLKKPLVLPTGVHNRVVVSRMQGHVLEMEDVHFHHDSAVLLPGVGNDGSDAEQADGIAVLQACLLQAQDHPEQKMLIVGHADTTGAAAYNLELSQSRADSVLFALTGDRDGWRHGAQENHQVEDYQEILAWVVATHGWPCDPGPIDNQAGPRTKRAVRAFQDHFKRTHDDGMSVDGIVGPQTWGAFFDLYMEELKRLLGVDETGLQDLQAGLTFADDGKKAVGCGEHHPIEGKRKDAYRSATNRRVELLFFDPGEEPKIDCHPSPGQCTPDACELYDPKMYRFEHLEPSMEPFDLILRVVPDSSLPSEPDDEVVFESTNGALSLRRNLATDCVDCVEYLELTFEQIDPALRYSLSVQGGANMEPHYIFKEIRGLALRARAWPPDPPPADGVSTPPPEDDPVVVDDGIPSL